MVFDSQDQTNMAGSGGSGGNHGNQAGSGGPGGGNHGNHAGSAGSGGNQEIKIPPKIPPVCRLNLEGNLHVRNAGFFTHFIPLLYSFVI